MGSLISLCCGDDSQDERVTPHQCHNPPQISLPFLNQQPASHRRDPNVEAQPISEIKRAIDEFSEYTAPSYPPRREATAGPSNQRNQVAQAAPPAQAESQQGAKVDNASPSTSGIQRKFSFEAGDDTI
ncbi:predicted protein [Uncinocarpus reesii 1704]|uniref:Uncharacterized protein n=1 Tax=Uncinocarpus reesii (strain UAMH 1704) TaxID=336963 RepID=C4JPN0_UNCRE|nr:uncharacterized protein UREG_03202 [Uncinocarpus reesii 1704]EEP78356.1 predicted protein [Uncinocarpus reesii 1704]